MTSFKKNASETAKDEESYDGRLKRIRFNDEIDTKYGFEPYKERIARAAWLINMHPAEIFNEQKRFISVVDYYFMQEDGSRFKVALPFKPYFYVAPAKGFEREVSSYLSRKYVEYLAGVDTLYKDDLDLPNHLIGLKRAYVKLSFFNVHDLMKVKRDLFPQIRRNAERLKGKSDYTELLTSFVGGESGEGTKRLIDQVENIVDIREYDVPYHVRVSIDLKIFVGHWYTVTGYGSDPPTIVLNNDLIERPDPIVLAFDIETTKAPLKFPDAEVDQIMMISYMIDGKGYLITNRQIVASAIDDFEYTPRAEYDSRFEVFNEDDEQACIIRFFDHIRAIKPHIISTYNGDSFDWPFVERRAAVYGLDMAKVIGFAKDTQGEYKSRPCIHMDAFKWVKRDSYLPIGSQNLKATARAKLRYDPIELDPELMCRMAQENPQVLASYSVSDAVATYYLYMKYVHPFIFALCTIIPMEPDEVLRKGSGTLCEALLMVEAYHCNIIFPNKQVTEVRQMTDDGHLVESETYVGGHVEALESGVFRADIPCRFRLSADGLQRLIDNVEGTIKFALEQDGISFDRVNDFDVKCSEIAEALSKLRDDPVRSENPLIYHLDVAAMYPNIILTNRLQPPAIVNEAVCAACDFNRPGSKCQRPMEWMWRGEIAPATRSEYQSIVQQLENEKFPSAFPGGQPRAFHQLPKDEQVKIECKRLTDYCKKAYNRTRETRTELRVTTICQRENSFYVDTVRAFRDRRYEYKAMLKDAKKKLDQALKKADASEIKSCKAKEVLFDSLQLAHKCILNSFYGYVMRKGSRWHSMEMAGIVCYLGANIITKSKELVDQIGRPLELDTDGIWCVLPSSFPENVVFSLDDPRRSSITISYPCSVLNMLVKDSFTNSQYHTLVNKDGRITYDVHSENSIAFEVDGPYKAIVLPAAKEEGKRLKKRYAVFNFDGSIAELKGFEVKRRGELQLIKIFQSSVFDEFLKGSTLEEMYQSVATVANYWLDILFSKGANLPDSELFELLSENRSLSRKLDDYGEQKSTSITTARRLAEFLGDEMVKDAGLNCKIVIAKKPAGAPVTERAIPMAIFQTEPSVKRHYLRKWLRCSDLQSCNIRDILDWEYYIERLGNAIQKIITIPAAFQGVSNPVPRIPYPDWLHKRLVEKTDIFKQKRITDIFQPRPSEEPCVDVEDVGRVQQSSEPPKPGVIHRRKRTVSGHFRSVEPSKLKKDSQDSQLESDTRRPWRTVLGSPPKMGTTKGEKLAWLSFMKRKWSHQKRQRDYFRRQSKNPSSITTCGLSAFVQQGMRKLLANHWQIVQVIETTQPGMFLLWIMVNEELRQIKLRVPRIFYINQRTPKESPTGEAYRQVNRLLPRANRVYHLYEYRVDEAYFRQRVNQLQAELSTPHVEGIYETQVPLSFRFLAQIGCVCKVADNKRQNADHFDFTDLESLPLDQHSYLDGERIKRLYLYHYTQDTRCILALFLTPLRKVHVFVADKNETSAMPCMETLYETERNKRVAKGDDDGDIPPSDLDFEVTMRPSVKEIYRAVQRTMKTYRVELRGPVMVIFESPLDTHQLLSILPSFEDFPLIKLRVVAKQKLFSTLDWQRVGARHVIIRYLNSNTVLKASLDLCRYLRIPLGNVPEDPTLFGADLCFARYLWNQNYVLWCSASERPDFGGKEVDDNRLVTDIGNLKDLHTNRPRLYDSVCFELYVASVPVTALLQAQRISEFEGVSGTVGFDVPPQLSIEEVVGGESAYRFLSTYDETALCAGVFRVLKSVVLSWVQDITEHRNVFADNQIIHFYRWLNSTSSLLYDPSLKRTVNGYMKKLMLLVTAELKRLGATIVFGSMSRIIICTNKGSSNDALGYVDFITRQLQRKDLFLTLDVTVTQGWKVLMWLDPANFGGIKLDVSQIADLEGTTQEDDGENPTVDMNWNMMYFLPKVAACQLHFKLLVAGYIVVLYKRKRNLALEDANTSSVPFVEPQLPDTSFGSDWANKSTLLKKEDPLVTFRQELVAGELSEKLYLIVEKIMRTVSSASRDFPSSELFPLLPGHHLKLVNPALEFTKAVCKVLSLDHGVEEEVTRLRRDLLKLVGVSEFADEAQWTDPCLSLILKDVICRNCNYCRDVDLCRDPCLSLEDADVDQRPTWRCIQCKAPYQVAEFEHRLISQLNSLSMSYVLQDMKCIKCKQIKQSNMNIVCECGGSYAFTAPTKSENDLNMKTFASIANYYNMKSLKEALHWAGMKIQ